MKVDGYCEAYRRCIGDLNSRREDEGIERGAHRLFMLYRFSMLVTPGLRSRTQGKAAHNALTTMKRFRNKYRNLFLSEQNIQINIIIQL